MPRSSMTLTPGPERLRLATTWEPAFLTAFKAAVPFDDRTWEQGAKVWWVHPRHQRLLEALACYFDDAWRVEGPRRTCLHTGRVEEQLRLFAEGA